MIGNVHRRPRRHHADAVRTRFSSAAAGVAQTSHKPRRALGELRGHAATARRHTCSSAGVSKTRNGRVAHGRRVRRWRCCARVVTASEEATRSDSLDGEPEGRTGCRRARRLRSGRRVSRGGSTGHGREGAQDRALNRPSCFHLPLIRGAAGVGGLTELAGGLVCARCSAACRGQPRGVGQARARARRRNGCRSRGRRGHVVQVAVTAAGCRTRPRR